MSIQIQKSFAAGETENKNAVEPGILYLVATPIGNLEDMTYRAVRTLQECDILAAEDTRQTRKLLNHFEITPRKLVSYHEHNKKASGPELIRLICEGQSLALVSDAGLPAISDPGQDLVQLALEQGVRVVPIPGANAALSALIASGLSTERFTFIGFLPRDTKGQEEILQGARAAEGTLLFYESPHRVIKTLKAMLEHLGNRSVVLARELTKRHEEWLRGTIEEALLWLEEHPPLGEYCIVLQGQSASEAKAEANEWWQQMTIEEHVAHYEEREQLPRKDAMKKAAKDRGLSKRDVYQALL
ncbi:16S rRNA (cytidine(1402)-2'-O)-methyltransferase [Paenibacillus bovis]|uniref:Ribosomal RNA small subunit methyltransferase I n=1 Tax=Paenibacillus bovis TaxID=1616788 RepID=A0A172ZBT2_9BACL|nr:16S rRNA (cytidine(1402)-2'-O)-methyltransferase [Paenibacillus bovis]ANF95101.1 16S rRNA (cytidine(1402)-2'-O)-methyltransferase [Paenibacillus bovis]